MHSSPAEFPASRTAAPEGTPRDAPPPTAASLRGYVARLPRGKVALWCYLVWYLAVVAMYFDPSLGIWINALGISGIIGVALWLGVRPPAGGRIDRWQVFRLFLTPFCVSSFSSLIKGQGFFLVFPPRASELGVASAACLGFVALVVLLKKLWRESLA
jgi:hypothetical protein